MYKPALDHKCYLRVTAFVNDWHNHLDRYPELLPSFEVVDFEFLYASLHQDKVLFCITADGKAIDASIVSVIICEKLVNQHFEPVVGFIGYETAYNFFSYLQKYIG